MILELKSRENEFIKKRLKEVDLYVPNMFENNPNIVCNIYKLGCKDTKQLIQEKYKIEKINKNR